MNQKYLFGGGSICFLIGVFGPTSPSPYVAAGIVLLSLALAVKNK